MYTVEIKTFRQDTAKRKNQVFILSKGNNSGRPSFEPCPNCFVITAPNPEECNHLYWLAYALWKSKGVYPIIRGSVIPFISLREYRKMITAALNKNQPGDEKFLKLIVALNSINEKEAHTLQTVKNINLLRELLLQKFIFPGL